MKLQSQISGQAECQELGQLVLDFSDGIQRIQTGPILKPWFILSSCHGWWECRFSRWVQSTRDWTWTSLRSSGLPGFIELVNWNLNFQLVKITQLASIYSLLFPSSRRCMHLLHYNSNGHGPPKQHPFRGHQKIYGGFHKWGNPKMDGL